MNRAHAETSCSLPSRRARTTRTLRTGGLTASLVGAFAFLVSHPVPLPAGPSHPGLLLRWLGETRPELVVLAGLRLLALAFSAYLILAVVAGVLDHRTGWRWAGFVWRLATTEATRAAVGRVIGAGMSASIVVGASLSPALAQPPSSAPTMTVTVDDVPRIDGDEPRVTMRLIEEPPADTAPTTSIATPAPLPPTTDAPAVRDHAVPSVPPTTTPTAAPAPSPQPPPAVAASEGDASPEPPVMTARPTGLGPPAAVWVIEPGQHLWHVAGVTLEQRLGRPPSDQETAHYLGVVIARNQDIFTVPGNPDLVFPGQTFSLPAVA